MNIGANILKSLLGCEKMQVNQKFRDAQEFTIRIPSVITSNYGLDRYSETPLDLVALLNRILLITLWVGLGGWV